MLFATALFLKGSWAQVLVNWHTLAPATGFSLAIVSAVGIVFSASAALLILHDLYGVLTDKLRDDELIMVRESEEQTKEPPA
jgi:TRAP-type C4-dicarboxylate transport system permease small subunit